MCKFILQTRDHDRPIVPEVYFVVLVVLFFFWLRSLSLVPVSNQDLRCANFFPCCVIGSVQNSVLIILKCCCPVGHPAVFASFGPLPQILPMPFSSLKSPGEHLWKLETVAGEEVSTANPARRKSDAMVMSPRVVCSFGGISGSWC